jgi:threonine dehydrogenase-like Zn-dependent dehydrogenase
MARENVVKAVVFKAAFDVAVETVADPRIEQPPDAVIGITTANICGSDLHPYEGRAPLDASMVLGPRRSGPRRGRYGFNYGLVFDKAISMGHGQCPVKRCNHQLRDLIIWGKARPSLIASHELPLEAAPDACKNFDQRADGWTKVLLKPGRQAA